MKGNEATVGRSATVLSRRVRASRPAFVALVMAADVVALVVAAVIGGGDHWWGWPALGGVVLALGLRGHYRTRIDPSVAYEIPSIVGCVAAPLGLAALVLERDAVSTALLRTGAIAVALVVVGRMTSYAIVRYLRARGLLVEPTLIIGAGRVGEELARMLLDHPEYGLQPVGFLDEFDDVETIPVLGSLDELDAALCEYGIRRVLIAFGATREPDLVPIVRSCDHLAVDIHVVPRFFELGLSAEGRYVDRVWGIPLLRLRRAALRSGAWQLRQAFGVTIAAACLLLLSPVYLAVALAVRLSGPGPILFRQQRIGQGGRPFDVLKFRTMSVNRDSDTTWSVKSDRRVTPVGRILRATSLDELPQLLNVLRGEMALVGPRPERPHFVDRFESNVQGYRDRHRVPAGVTGWAQVNGLRGDTSIGQRARFDNQYIENWSLWTDAVILGRTVGAVIRAFLDSPGGIVRRKATTARQPAALPPGSRESSGSPDGQAPPATSEQTRAPGHPTAPPRTRRQASQSAARAEESSPDG